MAPRHDGFWIGTRAPAVDTIDGLTPSPGPDYRRCEIEASGALSPGPGPGSGAAATAPARDAAPDPHTELCVDGEATVYRLYDVGYEIRLEVAQERLREYQAERAGPTRGEAQALLIRNTPVSVRLDAEPLEVGGHRCTARFSARIFDFGAVSLRGHVTAPGGLTWAEFSEFGNRVDVGIDWTTLLNRQLQRLLELLGPAIVRPATSPVTEGYVVFRIHRLAAGGAPVSPDRLTDTDLVPLLLNERRELSAAARRELLPHRFSYTVDDVTILTWDNALVVEPAEHDTDVEFVLEFANAQLLELRLDDSVLDEEIPRMLEGVARARNRPGLHFRRYARALAGLHTRIADGTELVERVENAFKVTDDVYLARLYSAALDIFRGREWRKGIDRKLRIIQDTYELLNAEAQAARTEALELVIVILFLVDIALVLWGR